MNATSISFGLLIALFTILLLRRLRKLKPQIAGYGTQRMWRIDYISIESMLLGVRQASCGGRLLDCTKMKAAHLIVARPRIKP